MTALTPPARHAQLVGVVQNRQAATLTARDCTPSMIVDLADGTFAVWRLGVLPEHELDDYEVHADEPRGGAW